MTNKLGIKRIMIASLFIIGWITIASLNVTEANSYLTFVQVEVVSIQHNDDTSTSFVSYVGESYATHHVVGSHQHESPEVLVLWSSESCDEDNCSNCS